MRTEYDKDRGILILSLTREESTTLKEKPEEEYDSVHQGSKKQFNGCYYSLLRGLCKNLGNSYIYLGHSNITNEFNDAEELEKGLGKIILPKEKSSDIKINLSSKGIEYFDKNWPEGIIYNQTNKLFITS